MNTVKVNQSPDVDVSRMLGKQLRKVMSLPFLAYRIGWISSAASAWWKLSAGQPNTEVEMVQVTQLRAVK